MLFADQGGRAHTPPRPLLIGLVLMLLFFTFSGDKAAPRTGTLARGAARTGELKEEVSKKIIYDLSVDNERLSRDLQQLKQYVLDVRRAARGCGCQLNDTVLTMFPELNQNINDDRASAAAGGAAGADGAGDRAAASSTTAAAAAGATGEQQPQQQTAAAGAAGAGAAAAARAAGGNEASNSSSSGSDSGDRQGGGSAGQDGAAGGGLAAGARRLQAAAAAGHVQ